MGNLFMWFFSGALLCYNKIMKNMLFVADGFTGGGLETRVIEQIKILKKKRVRFYLLCSKFNPEYKKYFTEVSEALKLSFQLHVIFARSTGLTISSVILFYVLCRPL